MTRQTKSPATRAQEAVEVLARRLSKLRAQRADLERQARDLEPAIIDVEARITYAKANPDLPAGGGPKTTPPTGGTPR